MARVLVVGDLSEQEKSLALRLQLLGHEAAATAAGPALIKHSLDELRPDAIVLRARGKEGRETFDLLSSLCDATIFVLAERYSELDLTYYLEKGAADYLTGAVSPKTLSARLGARGRWVVGEERGVIEFADATIDIDRAEVRRNGQAIPLTRTELRLIEVLNRYRGRVCSHRKLLEEVWGPEFANCAHYLRIYVGYLRRKLEDDARAPQVIQTVWGLGYRLAPAGPPASESQRAAARPAFKTARMR